MIKKKKKPDKPLAKFIKKKGRRLKSIELEMKKEKLRQAMEKLIMEITTSNYMAIK